MPSDPHFDLASKPLLDLGVPHVWSMLVTVFGDLAQGANERIEGPALTRLTEKMDIKPEAVRVALHRLRNEGWITSTKSGRTALHGLTAFGRAECRSVTDHIYARTKDLPQDWKLALTESNDPKLRDDMVKAGFVQVFPRVFVGGAGNKLPKWAVSCSGALAPAWLREQTLPSDLTKEFERLDETLGKVARQVSDNTAFLAEDAAVLRCLIVHHWRRLALRTPFLPPVLTGDDWAGHRCRDRVADLLTHLPKPELDTLAVGLRSGQ